MYCLYVFGLLVQLLNFSKIEIKLVRFFYTTNKFNNIKSIAVGILKVSYGTWN